MGLWRWQQAVTVDAPPRVVFDYLSDFPRLSNVVMGNARLLEADNGEPERFEVGTAVGLAWMGSDQGGPGPKSEMPDVLAASDACVATLRNIPMFRTTFPNTVFDYMAAGRPTCLAIDSVIRQVIEAAEGGCFVPPGDDAALAVFASRSPAIAGNGPFRQSLRCRKHQSASAGGAVREAPPTSGSADAGVRAEW